MKSYFYVYFAMILTGVILQQIIVKVEFNLLGIILGLNISFIFIILGHLYANNAIKEDFDNFLLNFKTLKLIERLEKGKLELIKNPSKIEIKELKGGNYKK